MANIPHEMKITIAQAITLQQKYEQMKGADRYNGGGEQLPPYAQFMRDVSPILAGDGAITVQWCGMWLAIEPDGHCHS